MENVQLDKEDGELSNCSFESVTSTPLSLSLSEISMNETALPSEGEKSPFTDLSSLDKMLSEEDEEGTNSVNKLEQEKNRLLKQIQSELTKKKKESKEQLLKDIQYLKLFKHKIKKLKKKGKEKKKKKSKKTIDSKIPKRKNSVVGIAQQEYIDDTLNEQDCEDDKLFPSLHEVRVVIPTPCPVQNELMVTVKGSSKPEKSSRIDDEENFSISHQTHSKSKRNKSTNSRNNSPRLVSKEFYDEIESFSEERRSDLSDENIEREKSLMKSYHGRHRIGSPTDSRHKNKTKSKSPNEMRHPRDKDGSHKKHRTKSKSLNERHHSRDEDGSHEKHSTTSKSPNKRRRSRDEDDRSKLHHYESQQSSDRRTTPPKGYRLRDRRSASRSSTNSVKHQEHTPYTASKSRSLHHHRRSPNLRRKSSHSDKVKRHPRPRCSSSSSTSSSTSGCSSNSEHSVKFIDFLVKSVIRNKEVVEVSSRTTSLRGSSPASDKTLPLPLNTTNTFLNSNEHNSSTIPPVSPEIQIISEVFPTSTSIATDINKNNTSTVNKSCEPIIPPSISSEQIVTEGERSFSSIHLEFPFDSDYIPKECHSNVQINPLKFVCSNIPTPLSHHSDDNVSNYDVISMDGSESLNNSFATSIEQPEDMPNSITIVEQTRETIKGNNRVWHQCNVEETTRNKANLITIVARTSIENNAIKTSSGQSYRNSKPKRDIEETTVERKSGNDKDLDDGQLKIKEKVEHKTDLEKRQSMREDTGSKIDSKITHLVQEKHDRGISQFVNKIPRNEIALDDTQSVNESHDDNVRDCAELAKEKLRSETDNSQKLHETIETVANKADLEDAQSTRIHLETNNLMENTHIIQDFLDSETVGASTQIVRDNLDVEKIIIQKEHTSDSMTCVEVDHQDLGIEIPFDEELGPLPMEDREILIHQLEMNFLLQNPVIPDFVANGVAEFFAELQRVLCTAAFNKNVKSDNLRIEQWFVIINSIYFDLVYKKNKFTFVKIVKYCHVLDVILDHFRDCVRHSIGMYAEDLPLYVQKLEAIYTWLNCHADKKMYVSSVDDYGALFFKKNKSNIKKFLLQYHFSVDNLRAKKLQRKKKLSNVPQRKIKENSDMGNSCCLVPNPKNPYPDIFEVTNKIDHMFMSIDGPKCHEIFEKVSLETLEHLLNRIKRELQKTEAEEYSNKCKELINEKMRMTNLKEYIEKMYKNSVVENNVTLPEQIDKLSAINNDLKSWKSQSIAPLKQKIKKILMKHEESFVNQTVEGNKKNDGVKTIKEMALQTVNSNKKEDIVEITKAIESTETHKRSESIEIVKSTVPYNKDGSVEIVKTFESNVEAHKQSESVDIVNPTILKPAETLGKDTVEKAKPIVSNATEIFQNNGSDQIVKPTVLYNKDGPVEIVNTSESKAEVHTQSESFDIVNPTIFKLAETLGKDTVEIAKPTVSNATETFQNNGFDQIVKSTEFKITDANKKNDIAEFIKPNVELCKKGEANKTVEPIASSSIESHKRNSVAGVNVVLRETENLDIRPTNDFTNSTTNNEHPNKNLNKSTPMNLDDSTTSPMDMVLRNYSSEVKDPRLQRQSTQNIEPVLSNLKENKVSVHLDESIPYKLIHLDVFIPFVRARNHLASYSKRKKEATEKGKSFDPDPRLEKDKMRLKQEIQEKLALSETTNDVLSQRKKQVPKDVDKVVNRSVNVVKAEVEKTRNSTTKNCDTVDLVKQGECKDPRLKKRKELEGNSKPKNVNDQDNSNMKKTLLENNSLSRVPLPSSQIIEALKPNKENGSKGAENENFTIITDLELKHSVLKTKSDVLPSDSNNTLCEPVNSLQQKIEQIGTALKLKTPTEQVKPVEGRSWSRIPFQCSQNNENIDRKFQYYKIPKILKTKNPCDKNISEPKTLKGKEIVHENSMKTSEPTTEKNKTLQMECVAEVLNGQEIHSGTNTIQSSQVEKKMTNMEHSTNIEKNAENVSSAVETPVKDKLNHNTLKKKSCNKQLSETKNNVLWKKISKLERDVLESKKDREKRKNIAGDNKFKVFDLFGETSKSSKSKRTTSESKKYENVKIEKTMHNVTEEKNDKSKFFADPTEDSRKHTTKGTDHAKTTNKSTQYSEEISHTTNISQSGNDSSVQRNVETSKSQSSNHQFSKNYMKHVFMGTPYLKPFRKDSKLLHCFVLLDQISSHKSKRGLLKRKMNCSLNIDKNLREKKRTGREEKDLPNALLFPNQTNIPKHDENSDEQTSKVKIRRKSSYEEGEENSLKNESNVEKQKDSNDSLCMKNKKSLLDTLSKENAFIMRIEDQLKSKSCENSTEKKIEDLISNSSSYHMEKRSNKRNKEGKSMENIEERTLNHDDIKLPACSKKAEKCSKKSVTKKEKRPSVSIEKIQEIFSEQSEKRSLTFVEQSKENTCCSEHIDISSQTSIDNGKECNKSDEVILSEKRGKKKEISVLTTNAHKSGTNQTIVANKFEEIKPLRSSVKVMVLSNNLEKSRFRSSETEESWSIQQDEISGSIEEVTKAPPNKHNETSSEQVNATSEVSESNELSVAIATSNKHNEDSEQIMNNECDEMISRSSKQAIFTSNKDDERGPESSEQFNKPNEPSIEYNRTRPLHVSTVPNEVNLSGSNKKEIPITDEDVQFIESVNIVTKKRDTLKKRVNVKQTWDRIKRHVTKSKLTMPSTSVIATIDLEKSCSKRSSESVPVDSVFSRTLDKQQSSTNSIEKDPDKMIVQNNAPKAIFLKRYSLDSNMDISERKHPLKINLRRCSEDTWVTVKKKEKLLNMLEEKRNIEKAILLLQGQSRPTNAIQNEPTDLGLRSENRVGSVKSIPEDSKTESDESAAMDTSEQSQILGLSELPSTPVNIDTTVEDKKKSSSNMVKVQYRPGLKKRKHVDIDSNSVRDSDRSKVLKKETSCDTNESNKSTNDSNVTKMNNSIPNKSIDLHENQTKSASNRKRHINAQDEKIKKDKQGKVQY